MPAFNDTPLEEPPLFEVELLDVVFVAVLLDEVVLAVVLDVPVLDEDCVPVFAPDDGVDEDLLPPPPQAAIATLARIATATAAAWAETVLLIASPCLADSIEINDFRSLCA